MLPNGARLGAHLPLGDGMVKAADRAAEIGASALQVFTDNPASWRRRSDAPQGAAGVPRAARRALDIAPLAIHAPYLVNLAGPEAEVARAVDRPCSPTSCGSLAAYGAGFVNVHIGLAPRRRRRRRHRGRQGREALARADGAGEQSLDAADGDAAAGD